MELKPGDRLGGRYLLVERLGAGGMGEVWLAVLEAGALRRRVVVKCVSPGKAHEGRLATMLADEARVLGLLHHPGIVAPIDFVRGEAGPVLVLEHVDGPSLRIALRFARRNHALLPEALAAWVGCEVARALHAAHQATDEEGRPLHLVHRDVSPDNVLLSRDGRVRLADFGVARAVGNSDETRPGDAPKGKLGYMPPEQAKGWPVGPTADVFALGRTVAEAADVGCGPRLRAVLDRAVAERPRDRFATCADLAAALADACPPPAEPEAALAEWLQRAAPEALGPRDTSAGGTPPLGSSRPPPAHAPDSVHGNAHRSLRSVASALEGKGHGRDPGLFTSVAPTRRRWMRMLGAAGAAAALFLPVAWVVAETKGVGLPFQRRDGAVAAPPEGGLRVQSEPTESEVFIDGRLAGVTPLFLHLSEGKHTVRVGSPRLERWRAADVTIQRGRELRLVVDLSE